MVTYSLSVTPNGEENEEEQKGRRDAEFHQFVCLVVNVCEVFMYSLTAFVSAIVLTDHSVQWFYNGHHSSQLHHNRYGNNLTANLHPSLLHLH